MTATGLDDGLKGYTQWRKSLWADQVLREDFTANANRNRVDARAVAEVIAMKGANGRGCFAAAETIAQDIGCNRRTVERIQKRLIELGWFTVTSRNGGRTRRALVLAISMPAEYVPASTPAEAVPATLAEYTPRPVVLPRKPVTHVLTCFACDQPEEAGGLCRQHRAEELAKRASFVPA